MSSLAISLIVCACVFGGAVFGMVLRSLLPEHHLSSETKDVVKLGAGLIGTMAALVLGLLVGSAKGSYDTQKNEVVDLAASAVMLDRTLAHFGPESDAARESLRRTTSGVIERLWSRSPSGQSTPPVVQQSGDSLYDQIHQLDAKSDEQRAAKAEAQNILSSLARTRFLLFAQSGSSISITLLSVVSFWLAAVFTSFGLFAPRNATVVATLLAAAMSVSGAVFLVLELDRPFTGMIRISDEPLRNAFEQLGH
ncbi:MAG: DUF4239 domain-containing protein [Phycisphaeraceae bacterium]|nr:DUF4239 domain-containing protein [Phycisphaeraceae bacterium]